MCNNNHLAIFFNWVTIPKIIQGTWYFPKKFPLRWMGVNQIKVLSESCYFSEQRAASS